MLSALYYIINRLADGTRTAAPHRMRGHSTGRGKQKKKIGRCPHQATLRVLGVVASSGLRAWCEWKSGPNSCSRGVPD
jgi:hypothetical protein